jgi:hypothetical protein
MSSKLLVPVSPTLADALTGTRNMLVSTGRVSTDTRLKKLNDLDDYRTVVNQLESLTIHLFIALGTVSFINAEPKGARFDMSAGTHLAGTASASAAYLRDSASELLRQDKLNKYESANVNEALSQLTSLYSLTMAAIRHEVRKDVDLVSEKGPAALIAVASQVDVAARRTAPSAQYLDAEDTRKGQDVFGS